MCVCVNVCIYECIYECVYVQYVCNVCIAKI